MRKTPKILQPNGKTRAATANPPVRFGRQQPTTEIKPAQIHELRVKTGQIQNQTKILKAQLARLRTKIMAKTEAINRTANNRSDPESQPQRQNAVAQLQRSIEAAENTLESLQEELEEAQFDDRTATYQELEEEVKATYLEYDRITGEIGESRAEAKKWDEKLRATDARADPEHATNMEQNIARIKTGNAELRDKWRAYQVKIHKMNVEAKIASNRDEKKSGNAAVKEAEQEGEDLAERISRIRRELEREKERYHARVEELMEVIDDQRRKIVEHLMGRDNNEE